ncbi:44390_t:CDS:2, partial [Gigaspora margarita]
MSFQNKPTVSLSKVSKRNLYKKEYRAIKKAKFENLDISVRDNINLISNFIINLVDKRETIFYDPLKYKTQNKTCKSEEELCEYIISYWKFEDFVASDLKSTNKSQSMVLMDPKLYNSDTSTESKRSLLLQITQTIYLILNNFQIPAEFINLLELEIFDQAKFENKNSDQMIGQDDQEKKIIAKELTNTILEKNINIKGYHYIFDPQYFKNTFEETIVDLYIFQNLRVVKNARETVQQYFVHMLNKPFYQFKEFSKELVKHFGAFTDSNNELYTISNTALSYNKGHLKCVQGLIQGWLPELKLVVYIKEEQAIKHKNKQFITGVTTSKKKEQHQFAILVNCTMLENLIVKYSHFFNQFFAYI